LLLACSAQANVLRTVRSVVGDGKVAGADANLSWSELYLDQAISPRGQRAMAGPSHDLLRKVPVTTMLLMFSVDDPVFVRVAVLAPLVTPTKNLAQCNEVGSRVTDGPFPVIVRLMVVVAVKLPEVPVIVTVEFPIVAPRLPSVSECWLWWSDSERTRQ